MIKKFILCCVLLIVIIRIFPLRQSKTNEVLTSKEIAQQAEYIAETYDVVTQDGYILQLDRIAGSKKRPLSMNKTPVLLFHGLLDCSVTWLVGGPEVGLGYILADQRYDVWLGNVRGNRYSRKHLNLTTSDPEFWMFSWHEIGIYDLPTMIDRIIEQTEQEKIFMVIHSQDGTVSFVMTSKRPEYQEKVVALSALACRTESIILIHMFCLAADIYHSLIFNLLGIYQFKPFGILLRTLGNVICHEQSLLLPMCKGVFYVLFGFDRNLNTSMLHLVSQYNPAGASIKQFAHYGQLCKSGEFRKFDYGLAGNIKMYGEAYPPEYNLNNVSLPVYYGTNDAIVDAQGVQKLYETLSNGQKSLIQSDNFAHLNLLWGNNVNTLVYNKILNFMKQHRK